MQLSTWCPKSLAAKTIRTDSPGCVTCHDCFGGVVETVPFTTIESALRQKDLIAESAGIYRGRPLLVTRNDYQADLFNGDIGVILPDPTEDDGRLWAWFIGADNQPRRISPARLPEYELAYAMTVHKAQGSEFESVLLILSDEENAVMTRELVYTGLTSASKKVTIWYDERVLRASVEQPAKRLSGLRDALLAAG